MKRFLMATAFTAILLSYGLPIAAQEKSASFLPVTDKMLDKLSIVSRLPRSRGESARMHDHARGWQAIQTSERLLPLLVVAAPKFLLLQFRFLPPPLPPLLLVSLLVGVDPVRREPAVL